MIFLIATIVGIYLIYSCFNQTSINYLSINDSVMIRDNNYNTHLYNYLNNKKRLNEFNTYFTNYRVSLVYEDILNNRTIRNNDKDYYFKKSLRESDFVTISVGMEEIANNYNKYDMQENYEYFNKMYFDIEKLIKEIKKYAQDKIVFIGYYNPSNYYDANVDEFFYNVDIKLSKLMHDNSIIYIDLYELIKGNDYKERNSVYLNGLAHKRISDIIKFYLE